VQAKDRKKVFRMPITESDVDKEDVMYLNPGSLVLKESISQPRINRLLLTQGQLRM
jgi:hypothetical protein